MLLPNLHLDPFQSDLSRLLRLLKLNLGALHIHQPRVLRVRLPFINLREIDPETLRPPN